MAYAKDVRRSNFKLPPRDQEILRFVTTLHFKAQKCLKGISLNSKFCLEFKNEKKKGVFATIFEIDSIF